MLARMSHNSPQPPAPRRGLVLLTVLICIVLLSLAAYNFSDLMVSEYSAADNYHKIAQARAYADSGIQYAMAALSSSDALTNMLNNNPYDNAQVFYAHPISQSNSDATGYFSLLAPLSLNDTSSSGTCQFGVMDEGAKINLNSLMVVDPTGNTLYNMLILLPNMTSEIANSILDWMDPDETARDGGAESDYYGGMTPPYSCKDGPLDSLEELLLVQGVTPQLLYGSDLNRNGYIDQNESNDNNNTPSAVDLGWFMYLTVDSREQVPFNPTNNTPLVNLNDTTIDLGTMYGTLETAFGDDLAKFITMYRVLGPSSSSTGTSQSTASTVGAILGTTTTNTSGNSNTVQGTLASYDPTSLLTQTPKTQIKSLYDLISAQVSVKTTSTSTTAGRGGKMTTTTTQTTTVYSSPLSDPSQQQSLLPQFFQSVTIWTTPEIPARINVTTASQEVLTALTGAANLSTSDVQAILAAQPAYDTASIDPEIYQTPTWLITQANISPSKLSKLDQYITTNTQVFRVQSIGYSDPAKGQTARIEAVFDANYYIPNGGSAQPRLLRWRLMDDFGKFKPPSNN